MKGLILAGGMGTRLRPVTYEIPKPLVPVKKKPILNYLIELMEDHGIREIGVLISRSHEEDFNRWKKAWADELSGSQISIFFEEKPRGTFGGVVGLRDWLGEEFVMTNGDELKDFDLTKLIEFHRERGAHGTIALVEVSNPQEYGVPVVEEGRIREFLEKPENPPSKFISSGLYVLDKSIFGYADQTKDFLMIEKDVFPKAAAAGKLMGLNMEGSRWYDCGSLERWERAMQEW